MAEIILIAAISENHVIGKDGRMPWNIKEDFKHFKEKTLGYPVIMGRKTYESLPIKPLPKRENIILSRKKETSFEETIVKESIEDAINYCNDKLKVFIIGGGSVYRQAIKYADTLEITHIHEFYEGDSFFPEIGKEWKISKSRKQKAIDRSSGKEIQLEFVTYKRSN